jgi:hypothetical protein
LPSLYAIQFEIQPGPERGDAEVFEALHHRIADWVVEKYTRRWNVHFDFPALGATLTPLPHHSIRSWIAQLEGGALERLFWVHPDDDDENLRWTTAIALARSAGRLQFAIQVGVASTSYVVRPTTLNLGRPRIVTQILDGFPCWIGSLPLLTKKLEVQAADIASFVETQLFDEKRPIPFVVVSHDRFTDRPVIDPDRIQQTLLGFAQVVVVDKWAAFRLTDCIGKTLSCYNGCIRVYWPGLKRDSDPLHHRLYFPVELNRFEYSGRPWDRRFFGFLADVSVSRYTDGEVIRQIQAQLTQRRSTEAGRLRQQIEEGRAAARSLQDVQELLDLVGEENKALIAKVAELEEEKERLASELEAVRANFAVIQQHHMPEAEPAAPEGSEPKDLEFSNVSEALAAAETDFDSDVFILESARESAEESDFPRPEQVYRALMAIREVGALHFDSVESGTSMGGWAEQLRKRGFAHYHQTDSDTVKGDYKKYARYRDFIVSGQKRRICQHLDLGGGDRKACLQIYFEPDRTLRKVIIAHCGAHLPFPRQRT